jgi:hypothetical protein
MDGRPYRDHTAAFKVKVAIEAAINLMRPENPVLFTNDIGEFRHHIGLAFLYLDGHPSSFREHFPDS